MNKQLDKKGFTIIEVVLVLAIAGLIFLMVFVALPSLQRGQANSQRQQDLSRISVQLVNSTQSSRGAIPKTQDALFNFVKNYLGKDATNTGVAGGEYVDPSGVPYTLRFETAPQVLGDIGYYPASECMTEGANQDNGGVQSAAPRSFALTVALDGQTVPYCVDS